MLRLLKGRWHNMTDTNLISLNTLVDMIDGRSAMVIFEAKDSFTSLNFILINLDVQFDDIYLILKNSNNALTIDIHTIKSIGIFKDLITVCTDTLNLAIKIL